MLLSTAYDLHKTFFARREHAHKRPALIAFSVYTNGQKLFQRPPPPSAASTTADTANPLACVHGIRVLSIVWVVFGHAYMIMAIGPLINTADLLDWIQTPRSMFLLSATVSVDTFFLMSGLLVGRSLLAYLEQRNGRLPLAWYYAHRYIRLTPSLAAAVLASVTVLPRMGDGPLWRMYLSVASAPCRRWWWTALLYVQNYANPQEMCVSHSWYLSVDTQLYAVAPALVWPLWWLARRRGKRVAGWAATVGLGGLTVAAAATVAAVWWANGFSGRFAENM